MTNFNLPWTTFYCVSTDNTIFLCKKIKQILHYIQLQIHNITIIQIDIEILGKYIALPSQIPCNVLSMQCIEPIGTQYQSHTYIKYFNSSHFKYFLHKYVLSHKYSSTFKRQLSYNATHQTHK